MADSRSRSASPHREPKPKKQKIGGFKWKEKKPNSSNPTDEHANDRGDTSDRLQRGYRDRVDPDERQRRRRREEDENNQEAERSSRRAAESHPPRNKAQSTITSPNDEARTADTASPENPPPTAHATNGSTAHSSSKKAIPDIASKFGHKASEKLTTSSTKATTLSTTKDTTTKPPKRSSRPSAPSSAPSGPLIVVNINDRLGTKAAIPCLASDSIKAFKAVVAAHIGRQPHEIMLKRQGERPFKDQLTLEDYGVSNGVQLDLELDTGD